MATQTVGALFNNESKLEIESIKIEVAQGVVRPKSDYRKYENCGNRLWHVN